MKTKMLQLRYVPVRFELEMEKCGVAWGELVLCSVLNTSDKTFSWAADLYMHLDDGFPNQSRSKEGPEGNQEMAASYPSQVEERIRDLKHSHQIILLIHSVFYLLQVYFQQANLHAQWQMFAKMRKDCNATLFFDCDFLKNART